MTARMKEDEMESMNWAKMLAGVMLVSVLAWPSAGQMTRTQTTWRFGGDQAASESEQDATWRTGEGSNVWDMGPTEEWPAMSQEDPEPEWDPWESEYGLQREYRYGDVPDYRYQYDQQLRGRVVGLDRLRVWAGDPQNVRLRFRARDGKVHTLHLGPTSYLMENLPNIRPGDPIAVRGRWVRADGRSMFRAREIRLPGGSFNLSDTKTNRTVEGRLTGARLVKARAGEVQAVIGEVRTRDGGRMEVLFGPPEALQRQGYQLRPGARVRVDGYTRSTDGHQTFFVQQVRVNDSSRTQLDRSRETQSRRQQARNVWDFGPSPQADAGGLSWR